MEEKKKIFSKETFINIKKTWKYAKRQKKILILYFVFSLFLCLVSAIVPILAAKEILYLTSGNFSKLIIMSLTIFGIEIFRNTVRFFYNKYGQLFFRETLIDLQYDLSNAMLDLEIEVIDKNSSGVFIDRVTKDTTDIANMFTEINYALTDMLTNVGVMVAIFIINKYMFLFFIISLIVLFIFKKIRMKKWFELDKEYRKINEKNTGLISELIRGIRDIKVLNATSAMINRMKEKLMESNQTRYKMSKIDRIYMWISGSVQDIFTFLFIFLGIYLINKNLLIIADLVVLYMYQPKVYNLLNMTTKLLELLKKFNVSSSRVFEILENERFKKEVYGNKKLDKVAGNFEFKNVSFSYNNENQILTDISFKINANETVSFIGKSGSGKSTIFSLLTKLYSVNKGKILIDGIDINDLDRDSLRNNVSIITQSPYIFNFSIKENLKIVNPDISDEEMIVASKLAYLHDFIMSLPQQYDTVVGEGGLTLSGGQRQRLAIARALVKKTEIILFDEATSALDNETQKEIQTAIHNMKGEYTILIIAHRLSTVIDSDRIILVDDGKIIAEGNHKDLLNNNKLYQQLYNSEVID